MSDQSAQKITEFKNVWGWLKDQQKLYVPYLTPEEAAVPAVSGKDGSFLSISMKDYGLWSTVDALSWKFKDGLYYGVAAADLKAGDTRYIPLEAPARNLLERFFHSPQRLQGVNLTRSKGDGTVMNLMCQVAMQAKLIGYMDAKEPWGKDPQWHVEQAWLALRADRIFEAFYHASSAREQGALLDEFFFLEFDCLCAFAMHEQIGQYMGWYNRQGGKHPRAELLTAAQLIWAKEMDQAKVILDGLEKHKELAPNILYERARMAVIAGDGVTASKLFEDCLGYDENHFDAWLGLGIALRNTNYQSGNESEMARAGRCFQRVIDFHGYRESEATHHLGTIHSRFSRWKEAAECYKRTLLLRHSGVSRRNLVLALHAMGNLEEALKEQETLKRLDPDQAQALEANLAAIKSTQTAKTPVAPSRGVFQFASSLQIDQLNQASIKAMQLVKNWGLKAKGDIGDFILCDEFFTKFAPAGYFSERSVFHGLKDQEVANILRTIATYLAGILVRRKHARWMIDPANLGDTTLIKFNDESIYKEPVCLGISVLLRYQAGARSDNITDLGFLVAFLPEYSQASVRHSETAQKTVFSQQERAEYDKAASYAQEQARTAGYALNGSISDLATIDTLIDECFLSSGAVKADCKLAPDVRNNVFRFIISI